MSKKLFSIAALLIVLAVLLGKSFVPGWTLAAGDGNYPGLAAAHYNGASLWWTGSAGAQTLRGAWRPWRSSRDF